MMARTPVETGNAFITMIFSNSWFIEVKNGEYLDIDISQEGQVPQFTTSMLPRHKFSICAFEALERHRWEVWVEVIKPKEPTDSSQDQKSDYVYPFVLQYQGCNQFQLQGLSHAHPLKKEPAMVTIESNRAVTELAGEKHGLNIFISPFQFVNKPSGIDFPHWEGDEKDAFDDICTQIGNPHSPKLTLALLSSAIKSENVTDQAWETVMHQLKIEIDYHHRVAAFFESIEEFVQNVFIASSGLVENVGTLVSLKEEDPVKIFIKTALNQMAESVGGLEEKGAEVASKVLSMLLEQLSEDRAAPEVDFEVSLYQARTKMSDLFQSFITMVQKWRIGFQHDWGKLRLLGYALRAGDIEWPENDAAMRLEAKRQLEIYLFKALLKLKWQKMTRSGPWLYQNEKPDVEAFYAEHKNYWFQVCPVGKDERFMFKNREGYKMKKYWLGSGRNYLSHEEPKDLLPVRLFDELKVPREQVFQNWGLKEDFYSFWGPLSEMLPDPGMFE